MENIKLPVPAGFRTRYRSEPGMLGHYPWTYADQGRRRIDRPQHESESLFTEAQVMALLAEARAQALRDAAQAAGPDDSYQDEWFKAKADAVRRILALPGA